MLQNIVSMKDTHYFGAHFTEIDEKDAQNLVTGWFSTKICSK